MPDELKNFLSRELDELKRNKIRAGALGVCFVVLVIFCLVDDDSGEEINLKESPPVTKDLPVKPLPAPKNPINIEGVTLVIGANADALNVADPFAGEEKPKPPPKQIAPTLPTVHEPPPIPKPKPQPESREKILLTGTAVSGDNKIAMFLRGKDTLFLNVGDEIGGKKILDITPDCVILEGGARVYLHKELN